MEGEMEWVMEGAMEGVMTFAHFFLSNLFKLINKYSCVLAKTYVSKIWVVCNVMQSKWMTIIHGTWNSAYYSTDTDSDEWNLHFLPLLLMNNFEI